MASVQFTGLASGLDTDAIVKAMLTNQQSKIDTMKQKKTQAEWKQEQWKSVNKSINEFYSKYVDKLKSKTTYQKYKSTTTDYAVGITDSLDMPIGRHKIEVTKLATEINKAAGINEIFNSKTKSFKELGILPDGASATMTVNDIDIEITESDSLSTLERKIKNADSSLNVNFDINNHKLFISSKNSGTEAKLNIELGTDSHNLFNMLGLSGSNGICQITNNKWSINEVGTGAEYKYNGIEMKSDTNEVEVNGLKLTFREETPAGSPVFIEVENDPDEVVSFIKDFVEGYNKLISDLNEKYDAVRITLKPLTDDEKESMTDKQIEKYEENIKASLLRRDSNLKNVLDTLRKSLQSVVNDNPYGSLSSIGITTGEYYENGKLYLDEDKLKEALQENPSAVSELFAGSGTTYEALDSTGKIVNKIKENTTGIGTNMYTAFLDMKKRIQDVKSYESYYNDKVVTNELKTYTENIKTLEKKYETLKKQYYKKFTAMETNLSKMNSQSSSLTSMLGQ